MLHSMFLDEKQLVDSNQIFKVKTFVTIFQ